MEFQAVDVSDYYDVNENFENDGLLRRLSPYATLSGLDARNLVKRSTAQSDRTTRSLHDLLADWKHETEITEEPEEISKEEEEEAEVVIKAADQGEIPVQYVVKGLRSHELPVIGVYVDKRITPGFRYRVRYLGRGGESVWDEARTLQGVGMGYGKRLTFRDPASLIDNQAVFWSDSDPEGFALSIEAVSAGTRMAVYSPDNELVGEVVVEAIRAPQEELSTSAHRGEVTKRVKVTMEVSITYYQRHHHHGLLDLHSHDLETVEGEAVLVKKRRSPEAVLDRVENLALSRVGPCTLVFDP